MMPFTRAVPLALRLSLAALAACALPRTAEELANSAAPTPGLAAFRSLALESECRQLAVPAELPDVATLVDTALLQRSFADTLARAFGLTFNRLGDLDEVRLLHANALGMDVRREMLDRFYPVVRAQQATQAGTEWSVRVVREAAADTWQVERSVFCPAQYILRDPHALYGPYSVRFSGEVHVTVSADGLPDAVYMPEVRLRDAAAGNRLAASRLRFVAATLNGEPVQSVVIFGREGSRNVRR